MSVAGLAALVATMFSVVAGLAVTAATMFLPLAGLAVTAATMFLPLAGLAVTAATHFLLVAGLAPSQKSPLNPPKGDFWVGALRLLSLFLSESGFSGLKDEQDFLITND